MGRRIVLVEDEGQLAAILARVLSRAGHDVRTASNGAEARSELAREMPDLLVLDINLPDETGWSVLRWLRTTTHQQPRVVVVTATTPMAARVQELKPDAVLTKPFPIDALIRIVNGPFNDDVQRQR